MTAGRRRRLATAVDDGLNPFHCSFRGSTLSLPALHPLQVTPPRKSVAIHPVIPLSLPAFSYLLPPCTPHCSLAPPPHSFNPTAHRAVYQPLRSMHTHTYTDTRQVFVAKVTPAEEWASPEKSFPGGTNIIASGLRVFSEQSC